MKNTLLVAKSIQNYLVYSFPFVVVGTIWSMFVSEKEILLNSPFIVKAIWELLSWNILLWFASLLVNLILLVFAPVVREQMLTRIANFKERDEREEKITGLASKKSFISTFSILIFLFFMSTFTINISKKPIEEIFDNKAKKLSLGFQFSLIDESHKVVDEQGNIIFDSRDLPLSKSAILLLLIIWQIGSFHLASRKLSNAEML